MRNEKELPGAAPADKRPKDRLKRAPLDDEVSARAKADPVATWILARVLERYLVESYDPSAFTIHSNEVGTDVGILVGSEVGTSDGRVDGAEVGESEGNGIGTRDGRFVGSGVGDILGTEVGTTVG